MDYVLTEDLVIPRGTVFGEAPTNTKYYSDHVQADVALGPDNTVTVVVPIEDDVHFNRIFVELKS